MMRGVEFVSSEKNVLEDVKFATVIFYIFKTLMDTTYIFITWDTWKFKLVVVNLFNTM